MKHLVLFQEVFVWERPVKMSQALRLWKRRCSLNVVILLFVAVIAPTRLLAQLLPPDDCSDVIIWTPDGITWIPADDCDPSDGTIGYTTPGASLSISTSSPTVNYGDGLTFTANISSGATGSVTFYDESTVIGSALIDGATATLTINSLEIGTHTITADWPGDMNFLSATSNTITQTVQKPVPIITWPIPASISAGTALSTIQLNAAANVSGSFAYSPDIGTTLGIGVYTLTAIFTPNDTAHYAPVTVTVPLVVSTSQPTATCY